MKNSLTSNMVEQLHQYVQRGEITPEALMKISQVVEANTQNWVEAKIQKLEEMVQEWEATMVDDDKTLYSLGLRRAVDVIREQTAYSQLPILEKPDTPDAE
jgi:hypothetical protein